MESLYPSIKKGFLEMSRESKISMLEYANEFPEEDRGRILWELENDVLGS